MKNEGIDRKIAVSRIFGTGKETNKFDIQKIPEKVNHSQKYCQETAYFE